MLSVNYCPVKEDPQLRPCLTTAILMLGENNIKKKHWHCKTRLCTARL